MSPDAANPRQQSQPGKGKEHKKTTCSDQVHGAEAKVDQRPVHGNDSAAMSADTIRGRPFEGSSPLLLRFSKLLEESKARTTSKVGRVVIVIRYDVDAPVWTHPLAPCNSQGLAVKIRNGRCWPD